MTKQATALSQTSPLPQWNYMSVRLQVACSQDRFSSSCNCELCFQRKVWWEGLQMRLEQSAAVGARGASPGLW